MIRLRRTVLAGFIALLLAAPPVGAQDTGAVAVNTRDGATVFDLAFAIHRVTGDVYATNLALAYASCETCQTIAISIQVVLVSGTAEVVAPVNAAIAINESCTDCQTLASAYQYVFALGTPIRLTGDGWQEVALIRQQLNGLRNEELPIDQVQTVVDELMDDLRAVLAEELVPIRPQEAAPEETQTPSPSPPAEGTATPTETPTATATETGSPEATPTETPTP